MKVSIIAAVSQNGVIGQKGKIPWNIPEDLKRFKKITSGHAVIMGRKTYESIGRPLPNRTNIVITRNKSYKAEGCIVVNSLEEALKIAQKNKEKETFIIGGEEIYKASLALTDKMYLTEVRGNFEGDAFFPRFDKANWLRSPKVKKRKFEFAIYEKKE